MNYKCQARRWLLVVLVWIVSVAGWAQSGPTIFITAKSKTDTPAKANQASDEATAVAGVLENFVAIEIQKQYPCANVTTDRDIASVLKYEHDHALLDPNYDADLSNLAGSLGARYLISVTAIQSGGQISMQASCMDTKTVTTVAKSAKQTNANNAADDAESLARDFAKGLGPLFAVTPQSGRTYPAGTEFSVAGQNFYRHHVLYKRTYPKALFWDQKSGSFESPNLGGQGDLRWTGDWGSCGGCSDCTCSGNGVLKSLTTPGRYRLINYTESIDSPERKVEVISEFTIAGSCKK